MRMSKANKENIPTQEYVGASWRKKQALGNHKGNVSKSAELNDRCQYLQSLKEGKYTELKSRTGLKPLNTNVQSKSRSAEERNRTEKKEDFRSSRALKEAEEALEKLKIGSFDRVSQPNIRHLEEVTSYVSPPYQYVDENNVSLFGDTKEMYEYDPRASVLCKYPEYDLQMVDPQGVYNMYAPVYVPVQPPPVVESIEQDGVPAFVDPDGYITLKLNHQIVVDISANQGVRIRDGINQCALAVSACGLQMAMVHKKGRVLQYGSRIEIQCRDEISVKNAKMYPKGISFTANNLTLVYLVDVAGARTTSDMFHDLYENNIADTLFREACKQNPENAVEICKGDLMKAQYWRNQNNEDCWVFGQIFVLQKPDGLTRVDRRTEEEFILLKASPTTGKVRLGNKFASITASLGEQSHVFVKAQERRMHYNGQNLNFTVRNAGHAAGFDETGQLRLF